MKWLLRIICFFLVTGFQSMVYGQKASEVDSSKIFSLQERFLRAQTYYEEAIVAGDSVEMLDKAYVIGKRFFDFGDYYSARKWLLKALSYQSANTTTLEFVKIYLRLSYCAEKENDWEDFMAYTKMSLDFGPENIAYKYLTSIYQNLSKGYLKAYRAEKDGHAPFSFQASLDSALYYNQEALKIATQNADPFFRDMILCKYGEILVEQGQKKEGLEIMQNVVDNFEKFGLEALNVKADAVAQLGRIYLESGELGKARKWLMKVEEIAKNDNLAIGYVAWVKELLGTYYGLTGNWKAAYEYRLEADKIRETENMAYVRGSKEVVKLLLDHDKHLSELDANRREMKSREEQAEIQSKLNWIVRGGLILSLIAGIFFFRLYRKYKAVSIENEHLVREQSHRLKNNLQSIYDLLSIQLMKLTDGEAREALEESLNRVDAITRVHQRIYQGERLGEIDLKSYLSDLVGGVLRSYNLHQVRQTIDVEEIWLHPDEAIPFGLIVNELVTNSSKYGLNHPEAQLEMSCSKSNGNSINFRFADNGPGFEKKINSNSFGLKLVELLAEQMGGSYTLESTNGTLFKLQFKSRKIWEELATH